MMRIAICGGIGSGKSAVTKILRDLGATVVVADEVNASLMRDPSYIREIEHIFPSCVHNNQINKKELARLVFSDEEKRAALMRLSHPLIFKRMFEAAGKAKIAFFEIPLFSMCDVSFDRIWYVAAERSDRVRAIVRRDGVTEDVAEHLISLQKGEDELASVADVVIRNDYQPDVLKKQVEAQYYSILSNFS